MACERFRNWKPNEGIKIGYKNNLGEKNIWEKNQEEWSDQIKSIVNDYYNVKEIKLTNRQIYYQLVSSDILPNSKETDARMNAFLTDLRYAGEVDWDAIEDRSRVTSMPPEWDSVADLIESAIYQFRLPRWSDQDYHVELFSEKQALESIIQPIAEKYHIRVGYNKGYGSSAYAYEIYTRLKSKIKEGKKTVILYVGDHDPSGLNMVADINKRMIEFLTKGKVNMFEKFNTYDKEFDVKCKELCGKCSFAETCRGSVYESISDCAVNKILDKEAQDEVQNMTPSKRQESIAEMFRVIPLALNLDQIKQYHLPPNPAKTTDPRAKWYIAKFGNESWELDALKPEVLIDIVEKGILRFLDIDKYNKWIDLEEEHKKSLISFSEKFK